MMGILDGRPVLLTLPVMLHTHVSHRESIIERRAQFDLEKAQARAHILEGLVLAQDRIDDVVAVGKASPAGSNLNPYCVVMKRWPVLQHSILQNLKPKLLRSAACTNSADWMSIKFRMNTKN